MCLAIPMRVKSVNGGTAVVTGNGVDTEVKITLTPDVKVNDSVLIHAGFIIEKLDEESAREIEKTWEEYMTTL